MFSIDTPTASNGKFVEGNANQSIKGTQVSADWLNAVQAEILNPIEAAGITPNKEDSSQLLAAIKKLFVANSFIKSYDATVTSVRDSDVGFLQTSIKKGSKVDFTISINNKTQVNAVLVVKVLNKTFDFSLSILGFQSVRFVAEMSSAYSDFLGNYNFPYYTTADTCNVDLMVDGFIISE